MKNLSILIIVVIVLMAIVANAGPWVVCDDHPLTTSYIVVMNSGEEIEVSKPLQFDLSGINEGEHVVEVRAKNVWGVSSISPLEFTKELPQSPTNMRLSNE